MRAVGRPDVLWGYPRQVPAAFPASGSDVGPRRGTGDGGRRGRRSEGLCAIACRALPACARAAPGDSIWLPAQSNPLKQQKLPKHPKLSHSRRFLSNIRHDDPAA